MGLIAASGGVPGAYEDERAQLHDRRLRSRRPHELITGKTSLRPVALAQAYLAVGAGVIGIITLLLPHPPEFNVEGLLTIQVLSILLGIGLWLRADYVPYWSLRAGPTIATVNTTLAVYFSGDATSGFALFYVWVALYIFYFPSTRAEAVFYVSWAVVNYAVAIAITPSTGGASGAGWTHFVIMAGTLLTAATLLTYLRGRMEKLMHRLTDAARRDPLTGLPNRVALHEVIARELERARPERRPVSVLVLDLDSFKRFNDRRGVAAGDDALQRLGGLLEDGSRLPDTVTRSSGGEFALVLPETDKHGAFLLAEDLLAKVRETIGIGTAKVTGSAGVACFPEHGESVGELLSSADEAMRAAKALGRDRAVLFSPEVTSTLGMAVGRKNIENQAQLATVLGLAEALDQRDSSTARHSQTVGRLCELMAIELRLAQERVQRIRLAGILHDIGKIGVPDSILRKPGPLTGEEWAQMQRHPEIGARILSSREMDDIRKWISAHHERPDGKGYPRGIRGDQIPLEASILAVADAYEAMITDRVYRLALGPEKAREELRRCSGTQFAPRVVVALLKALDRGAAEVRVPAQR
jgi:diguanylate cyclase (GGDEF)-like protein/putative nucleotidyltransferase with HDIG domain